MQIKKMGTHEKSSETLEKPQSDKKSSTWRGEGGRLHNRERNRLGRHPRSSCAGTKVSYCKNWNSESIRPRYAQEKTADDSARG